MARTHYEAGLRLLDEGDTRAAFGELETAIAADPGYPPPYFAMADAYAREGNLAGAVSRLETLRAANPNAEHILCREGDFYLRAQRLTRATATARAAVAREPNCALAHLVLGAALAEEGVPRTALAELEIARRLEPHSAGIALTYAQALAHVGRIHEAILLARQTLKQPAAQGYYVVGKLLLEYGPHTKRNWEAATMYLLRAFQMAPGDPAIQAKLGIAFDRLGNIRDALTLLSRSASSADADALQALADASARLHLKNSRSQQQRAASVASAWKRVRTLRTLHAYRPDAVSVTLKLAPLEVLTGHIAEALDLVHDVLAAQPDNPTALKTLWFILDARTPAASHRTRFPQPAARGILNSEGVTRTP
ncbi:MAG: tetratricopeptide repeat protein [Chthonomonadales bacterium]